jgi:hypothetical protein
MGYCRFMSEYGIFNAEGLIEGQFYSFQAAAGELLNEEYYGDDAWVNEVCPEHTDQPYDECETCDEEEEEED